MSSCCSDVTNQIFYFYKSNSNLDFSDFIIIDSGIGMHVNSNEIQLAFIVFIYFTKYKLTFLAKRQWLLQLQVWYTEFNKLTLLT